MPDLPLLSCVLRLAANLALQLHSSADFQVVLKKVTRKLPQYPSTTFSLFFQ